MRLAIRCLGPALLAVGFAALAAWSWGKWTDVQIDFGSELYVPWQITEGRALYRDIAYRHGPLSPHVNALWFSVFGVSLRTLVWCNLAILAGACALTFRIFARSCDRLTATVAVAVLLAVFGFSQYVGVANYNHVTPYQHAQTHGLALGLAMIASFGAALRTGGARWVAVAGVCLGLVALTKLELAVPAAATAGLGWMWLARAEPDAARRRRRGLMLLASALLPVAAAFGLLAARMPPSQALAGVLGNWTALESGVLRDPFYLRGAGLDDVSGHLLLAARMFLALGLFAAVLAAADRWLPARSGVTAAAVTVVLAAGLAWPDRVPWAELPRALPFTTAAAGAAVIALAWRAPDRADLLRWAPLALWSVFALGLLGKMLLAARVHQYGFVLALPATLLLVAVFVHLLPAWLRARGGSGGLARAVGVAAVAAGVVFFLRLSDAHYARKDLRVGTDGDAILVEGPRFSPRGAVIAEAMDRLARRMPADATLLVLPEGAGINYWLRRPNPARFHLFLPTELDALGGEGPVLEGLRQRPPDFVLLLHRAYGEFGAARFGSDARSGRDLLEWVNANYDRRDRIGSEPFAGRGFGAVILERRAGPSRAGGPAGRIQGRAPGEGSSSSRASRTPAAIAQGSRTTSGQVRKPKPTPSA